MYFINGEMLGGGGRNRSIHALVSRAYNKLIVATQAYSREPDLTGAYQSTEESTEYDMKLLRELFAYETPMRSNLRFRPQ